MIMFAKRRSTRFTFLEILPSELQMLLRVVELDISLEVSSKYDWCFALFLLLQTGYNSTEL